MVVMCVSRRDGNRCSQKGNPICKGYPGCPAKLLYLQQKYTHVLEADDHFIDKIILYCMEEATVNYHCILARKPHSDIALDDDRLRSVGTCWGELRNFWRINGVYDKAFGTSSC